VFVFGIFGFTARTSGIRITTNLARVNIMRDIRVAYVRFEHAAGDKQANLRVIRNFVAQATQRHVELIVFLECYIIS
jgi:hypothetical protein